MKRKLFKLLLATVCLLGSINASAHDVAVENEDGTTIYYNYINNGTELEVTYRGSHYYSYSNEYTGSVVIPETVTILNKTRNVTRIGSYAFINCSGLTSVTIPASVTSIGYGAFSSCSGLTSVTIPSSVTSIASSAFSGCSGLTSVTIPSSVTSIGSSAFSGCSGLTSVTISEGVASIGDDAFWYCSGLKKVVAKDLAAWCGISFGNTFGNPLYIAKHLYSDEDTEITDLVIPEGVTSISKDAFNGCSGLTSVTIPSSVTSIGSYAFKGCDGLKKVIVKDLTAWCGISFDSYYCNPLYYVEHLYSDKETEITDLVIPEGVTSIGNYAFYHCIGLTSVTIPSSVTSIGRSAFSGCSGLTSVTIPSSVTSIGSSAFSGCSGLTSVTIPGSVTNIGDYAFYNCNNLADFVSLIQEPFWVSNIVSDFIYKNGTLYIPKGTIEKYKSTNGWKNFVWMEEGVPMGIKQPNSNGADAVNSNTYYDLRGNRLNAPKKGLNIINGKKIIVK